TLQTRGVHDAEARLLLDADLPQWAKWARRTGLAISIDYVTPDFVPQSVWGAHDVIRLSYRAAKVAEVGTWAVEHVAEHEERDGGGNITEVPAHYKVRRKTRQR